MIITSVVGKQQEQVINAKVMGCHENKDNLSQLWAFIPEKGNCYIVHIETNLALKVEN